MAKMEPEILAVIKYFCPACGEYSGNMGVSKETHKITDEEKQRLRTSPVFETIGHEILICTCGRRNTWFDLKASRRVV